MKPAYLFLFILAILLQFFATITLPFSNNPEYNRGNETDHIALLGIKSQLIDNGRILSSWNHSLHHCDWEGVICGHRHRRVTILDLRSRSLAGTISPLVGNLSFLRQLELGYNSLHGQIPTEIGRLFRLHRLYLNKNLFSGSIPSNISGCFNLEYLTVGYNKLEGALPMGLGALTKLRQLDLTENHFTGSLFKVIANLTSLQRIYNYYNAFTEIIPDNVIARMRNLVLLGLPGNGFHGVIPPSIFNLSSLHFLELHLNDFEGSLPKNMGQTLIRIEILNLAGNHLSGSLPISMLNITSLSVILLENNNFVNDRPLDFRSLQNLAKLYLSENDLSGSINFVSTLINCSWLDTLGLSSNHFTGLLPKSIANLSTNLQSLEIGDNQLRGEVPIGLSKYINLQILYLGDNQFTGTIPHDLSKLHYIEQIYFDNNGLTGTIPNFFRNLSHLSKLFLGNNKLEGSIPPSLGSCQNLLNLDLPSNNLNGHLPSELFGGEAMLVWLNMSHNQLQGPLPLNISNQRNLVILDMSQNRLSGKLPDDLAHCLALQKLFMGGNFFHGSIPSSFSSLQGLQEVDFSHNTLSGPIPDYLCRFSLAYLDLSYNKFEGKVPTSGVFANASAISLVGNGRLCGGISSLKLPKCMEKEIKKRRMLHPLKVLIPTICATLFISVAMIALLYLTYHKKKKTRSIQSGSLTREAFLRVSYHTLLKATGGFSSENLLGKGTFGSVFKGILDPNGMIVAVKVLNIQLRGAFKSFMAECTALRNIHHRNLVEIITACSSIDFQGNDFKALVYKFMPNGSLDKWLHEDGNLSLVQRVDIAIDVACALNYLHYDCEPPIVHCDLKPSNILLDDDMVAHVGDFGLAKFISPHHNQIQSSSIGIRGTVGYAAPEYGIGGEVSINGDTYSFGILLLELITRKRPTDSMFGEDLNLNMYAKMALPDQVLQIVDPIFIEHESERRLTQIELQQRVECMVAVVKIGVACSNQSPRDRMTIDDALSKLQRARKAISNTGHRHNLQRGTNG